MISSWVYRFPKRRPSFLGISSAQGAKDALYEVILWKFIPEKGTSRNIVYIDTRYNIKWGINQLVNSYCIGKSFSLK